MTVVWLELGVRWFSSRPPYMGCGTYSCNTVIMSNFNSKNETQKLEADLCSPKQYLEISFLNYLFVTLWQITIKQAVIAAPSMPCSVYITPEVI